ncbi:hypothetical protein GOBAR_DD09457 [Gossypium barbadense]|nr:hypothetical protein GOBAR_DD09457 [Gossypium barbadense]
MEESRSALHDCNLLDLGYQRVWFTWEHDRLPHTNIKEQLNCAMGTPLWKSCLPIHQVSHLSHSISDYCPLLITMLSLLTNEGKNRFQLFHFEAWWVLESRLDGAVSSRLALLGDGLWCWGQLVSKGGIEIFID